MKDGLEKKPLYFTLPRIFALAFQPEQYVTLEGLVGALGLLAGFGLLLGATVGLFLKFAGRFLRSRKKES